ncbi:RagB/SusD family nutrient uptake outer membrane protein [Chitinophaga cymbidii]|uniref:RagB/SusD family nutrient uptake outer membrane protein n=1 Tax=Chitinophaga cymbidii TaxID=1096750 RepID=UPI00164CC8B3|nr:RagB/SusD family nutrient uptake outer membrane protein [Chitinophaga cymbidii]
MSPKTQTREEDQFSSAQGFIDALFGAYQQAASDSLYGKELTFGALDVLAGRYENKASGAFYGDFARYNYTNVSSTTSSRMNAEATLEGIWSTAYATIAQCNYILKNIEAGRSMLGTVNYSVIKGEAIALRAFLHFDLLRMYAPAYLDGANAAVNAIPYMEQFTVLPQEKRTVAAILDRCEQELLEAEQLLSVHTDIDQIAGNQGSVSIDLFLMYRQNHLNYWAVKGALARLYLYKGDKPQALKYAKEVIESGKFRFMTVAELGVDPGTTASDITFTPEHIFSVYKSDLRRLAEDLFKPSADNREDNRDLYSTVTKVNNMYETSVPGYGTDMRIPAASKPIWSASTAGGWIYTRKYYADNQNNVKQRVMPVMRLPEMYYIAAEAAALPADGLAYLNEVRTARGLPVLTDAATLDVELQKEYRKEFYGEGQFWFYLKRRNVTTVPDGVGNPMTEAKYTFPLPLVEIEFGK